MTKQLQYALFVLGTLGALAVSGVCYSQSMTFKSSCVLVGNNAPEPLGDRDGHSISVGQYACRVEDGPLTGGVITGFNTYEWNGPNAVVLNNVGVIRKPGSTTTYSVIEGKNALLVTDGKVTGFAGSGRGKYAVAVGAASALAGKAFNYTFKYTGPGQFVIETTVND